MKVIIRIQIYFQLIICLFDLLKHHQTNKQSNENKSCADRKLNGTWVVAIIMMLNDIYSARCYMKIRVLRVYSCLYLWKGSLNSDDRQFHKYQQNEQSPIIIITHWKQQMTTTYMYNAGIPGSGLEQIKTCGGVNR